MVLVWLILRRGGCLVSLRVEGLQLNGHLLAPAGLCVSFLLGSFDLSAEHSSELLLFFELRSLALSFDLFLGLLLEFLPLLSVFFGSLLVLQLRQALLGGGFAPGELYLEVFLFRICLGARGLFDGVFLLDLIQQEV